MFAMNLTVFYEITVKLLFATCIVRLYNLDIIVQKIPTNNDLKKINFRS